VKTTDPEVRSDGDTELPAEHLQRVAEAFTRKAPEYETFWVDHPNFSRMRDRVHAHFESVVSPEARVLELNAGMGIDAVRMVRRGHRVHATDLAPGMLSRIKEKAQDPELGNRLTVQRCSYTDLDQVQSGPFDAVFSNFGGLNCVHDLRLVTRHLDKLLVPGGVVTWVIMPRICPWEWLALRRGDWRTALRRFHRHGVMAQGLRRAIPYVLLHARAGDACFRRSLPGGPPGGSVAVRSARGPEGIRTALTRASIGRW
jgi:ubiquinone/menaquinone biosynthesis C-methylase UbiE